MPVKYDLAIMGGGPAGYAAAIRGAGLGKKIALVEKESIGGVCLNRGCIPTKSILSDVEGVLWANKAARNGIIDMAPHPNFQGIMARKNKVVQGLVSNLSDYMESLGVDIYPVQAKAMAPDELLCADGAVIKADTLFIATGSTPVSPRISGLDLPQVMGSREILQLEKVPKTIGIIGGGVIGQEFGAIFSGLGAKVMIFEALDRILPTVDADISKRYLNLARPKGIKNITSAKVNAIKETKEGLSVEYEKGGKEKKEIVDVLLVAVGRKPRLEEECIGRLGLELNSGAIPVDDYLRTSVQGIYAGGDCIGRLMLAHVASFHGEYIAESLNQKMGPCDDSLVPACLFTHPQIAWVGPTEESLQESGVQYRTSVFSLTASGKAQAKGDPRGWLKLMENTETGKIIAAVLMGPDVSEIISGITMAISRGFTASDIADIIHPHPTISEALRETALGFLHGPIHSSARIKNHP